MKELQSIVNYEIPYPGPVVSSAFNNNCIPNCSVVACSCTAADGYWSSTALAGGPYDAWYVFFGGGLVYAYTKASPYDVRGVRGGL